ncbi:MAG: L,D-transpeptidase, partial [Hyphomicrobiaceae bacterium]|nr:L,D-transpeptidase [Hyphomicrobiaceae bacterium]
KQAALDQEAAEAAAAAAQAEDARRGVEAAVRDWERAAEPISILVSRKAGRVFVRQGSTPIHEAPVRVLDGPPLGTHVYLAMAAAEDGVSLRWVSVSLPSRAPQAHPLREARGPPGSTNVVAGHQHETALGALARFALPEETARFIADRLWPGATLIVSDYGASGETGIGTDFIVITR